MAAIRFEVTRWPVLVVAPSASFTDADIDQFLAEYEGALKGRAEPYATVLDLRCCKDMSPTQRKRITQGMEKNREQRKQWQRGFAMVFDSAIMRMILTAILWATKPEYEIKVFSDIHEAMTWANMRAKGQTASLRPSQMAQM